MTAALLDGKKLADQRLLKLKKIVKTREAEGLSLPGLAVILVGNNSASQIYVQNKKKASEHVGFLSWLHELPESTTQTELLNLITRLNHHAEVNGILVQLPLPKHIDTHRVLETIFPHKDVDGFHPYNLGRLAQKWPLLRPCTPFGVMNLLQHYQINIRGIHAVVVGASNIVGRPMALELLQAGATVTICHRFTQNLKFHVSAADLLVVAIGKYDRVKSEWIKPGAVVVDVGIHRTRLGKIYGDLNFEEASQRASWITPVPGGIGPMTIITLLENTLLAANLTRENETVISNKK